MTTNDDASPKDAVWRAQQHLTINLSEGNITKLMTPKANDN
jgi:hypothetical protein